MRNVMFACAVMVGFTNVAAASELGIASYYLNPHFSGLIAAHKTLPFGTRVRVVNLDNGRSAILKIVDRGPFIRGRIIDVTEKSYTIELTGDQSKNDAFLEALEHSAILETVRTGSSGIGRGERILRV